jgi:hypothetical protein
MEEFINLWKCERKKAGIPIVITRFGGIYPYLYQEKN